MQKDDRGYGGFILYGSYAKGNWRKESDIDIAVIVTTIGDDYLEVVAMLYKLRRNIGGNFNIYLVAGMSIV